MQSPALNLRIILSPLKPVFPLSPPLINATSSRHLFTAHCSRPANRNPNTFNFKSRRSTSSTQLETRTAPKEKRKPFMEERGKSSTNGYQSFEFNRKRAEGLDYSNKPKKNLQLKVRKLNPTNTISYVQILGTGMDTQDTSPSVLLFFDKQRFIFNAGEGLQRFCTEHKIKLSKIDHIFLSRVCSETAGGLPGLLLTLAGIGLEGLSVNVWGPSDLNYMVDAMKMFVPHAAMVHTRSFGSKEDDDENPIVLVDDDVVKISAVILKPRSKDVKPGEISVVYICELPEIAGKFDPAKAKACGLRPGPKYGLLQSGKSVKSDTDDSVVHPSDVMGPSVPGPVVFLVDCPSEVHLRDLLDKRHLNDKKVNCIVHLTPSSLISSPDYQSWMSRFSSAQHIMAGHEKKGSMVPIMKSSAKVATWLNYLCPQFFPATGLSSSQEPTSDTNPNVVSADNLLKFILRPHVQLGLDNSCIPSFLSQSQILSGLKNEVPEVDDAAKSIKSLWFQPMVEEPWLDNRTVPACLNQVRRDDLEIVLLGTGSSQPSKYRNVTSIFINLFSNGGLLLDCGEGTLGQLKRRYGLEGADEIVRNLKCIWISHIHADHHSGLARILSLRRVLLKDTCQEPILVVGPRRLKRYLDSYQRLEDLNMQFIDCWSTSKESWASERTTLLSPRRRMERVLEKTSDETTPFALASLRNVLSEAGLESLVSFPVVHCPQAYGVALCASERVNRHGEVIPGWKVVYSGDTRPCRELVEASQGATVLIHEATFEDGLMEEALARNHSTTKEATEVGDAAGAYRVVLTHFSQRYPKVPVLDDTQMHRTCVAFDLMSVNLADLHVMPKVLPYLKLLFKNDMAGDETDDVDLAHLLS